MRMIYDGIVAADAHGAATVQLPEGLESANREFGYLLTALGGPAPNLHVSKTLQGNTFSIRGAQPGQEISWQLTVIDPAG